MDDTGVSHDIISDMSQLGTEVIDYECHFLLKQLFKYTSILTGHSRDK